MPATLDAFFALTGTSFVNDVVALVDVEKSAANRRKSMAAPSTGARGPSGPPTFADLAVAGAIKNLVHQLYTNESQILSEQIDELQHMSRQQEELIRHGQPPAIFRTWATASEEAKNVIKVRSTSSFFPSGPSSTDLVAASHAHRLSSGRSSCTTSWRRSSSSRRAARPTMVKSSAPWSRACSTSRRCVLALFSLSTCPTRS